MTSAAGVVGPSGSLGLKVYRAPRSHVGRGPGGHGTDRRFWAMVWDAIPRPGLGRAVNVWRMRNQVHFWRGAWRIALAKLFRMPVHYGVLYLRVIRANGLVEDLGLAGLRLVTDNGMGFEVDAFQNSVELENMKYHGIGTGSTAEAATDSALVTELTTQYNPDNTRATGSTTEASQKVYRTVGTNTVDASAAIQEHGIFSQAATGGGVLLDRTVFSTVNLGNGDSLQTTYDLTFNSGG